MVRAAVLDTIGGPTRLTELELPDPGPGQVRVRLAAAAVCHTDLSLATGALPQPVPVVLGHEAAGVVVATGSAVPVGTPVALTWAPACGTCRWCTAGEPYLCGRGQSSAARPYARLADGTPVYPGLGVGAFAEETVVSAAGVVPLPAGLAPAEAAVLGCAVLTGYGAVRHVARVRPGESVAVVGTGGVGLAVLRAARLAGANPLIAVDRSAGKEELARAQGATEFVLAGTSTPRRVRALTGGYGADVAVECAGTAAAVRAAWACTRRGGRTVVLGVGRPDDQVSFSAYELFHTARTLTGSVYGNADPVRDLPLLAVQLAAGELDLGGLITDRVGLADLDAAFARMREGRSGRTVIEF